MSSGRYRHRITIDHKVESRDEYGGPVIDWQPFAADVPAEVLTGPGRELRAANAPVEEVAARINFRYVPGIDQAMRVRWLHEIGEELLFNIRSVEFDRTTRRETRLICVAGADNGG